MSLNLIIRRLCLPLLALTMVVLAGCSENLIRTQSILTSPNAVRFFNSAARDGVVKMTIFNNPFAASGLKKNQLDDMVATSFVGAYIGRPTQFSSTVEPEFGNNTRIVIHFQPSAKINSTTICNSEFTEDSLVSTSAQYNSELRARAALCMRETPLTYAVAFSAKPKSVDDKQFREFIRALARKVLIFKFNDTHDGPCVLTVC